MDDRPLHSDGSLEKNTATELDEEVRLWRKTLVASPAFRADNLDELEAHLRDSVAALQQSGLSTREAVIVAARRIGGAEALEREFGKANRSYVWIDRTLWMVLGGAAFAAFRSAQASVQLFTSAQRPLPMVLPLIIWMAPIVVTLLALRSFVRGYGLAPRLLTGLLRTPTHLAGGLLALGGLTYLMRLIAFSRVMGGSDALTAIFSIVDLVLWVVVAAVVWALANRRMKSSILADQ